MKKYIKTQSGLKGRDAAIQETRLSFNSVSGQFEEISHGKLFIKGPIPYDWMLRANLLPGKACAVSIALWFLRGLKCSDTFVFTAKAADLAGCSRQTLYRSISALEDAGLIEVTRRSGGRHQITICL
jgi:hypothetical protein